MLRTNESPNVYFVETAPHPLLMATGQICEEAAQPVSVLLRVSVVEVVRDSLICL